MTARMFRLTQMHQRIDARIRQELRRINPSQFKLMRLKRLKLRVKDALHRLTRRTAAA